MQPLAPGILNTDFRPYRADWFRQGKQRWMLALVIGNTCMLIGFFGRIGCHYNPYSLGGECPKLLHTKAELPSLGIYVFSTLFILLSVRADADAGLLRSDLVSS